VPVPDTTSKSLPGSVQELWLLLRDYARQETIEPLKGLGRFVAFGVAGSLLVGIGVTLLVLAGLRALQTETGTTFTGNWSWAPYLIVTVAAALVAGLAVRAISHKRSRS
jgi:predicted cobalt transporter CbtA